MNRRWLLPALALVALFGGFAGYQFNWWRESPREAWEAISSAAAAGDYGAVWDRIEPATQARMAPELRGLAPDPALTDRERFVLLMERRPKRRAQLLPGRVAEVRVYGNRASVRLDRPDPTDDSPAPQPTSGVYLTRHDGRWLLSDRADDPSH